MWGENEADRMPIAPKATEGEDFFALIVCALLCVFGICVAGMLWMDCGWFAVDVLKGLFA